jgi:hypothetical protein
MQIGNEELTALFVAWFLLGCVVGWWIHRFWLEEKNDKGPR